MLSKYPCTLFGAITGDRLGNGVWESAQFDNNRAQVKQIGLGTSAGDTSLLKLEYDYGTTDNNGSLRQQKITVPGIANQLVQNYTYDNLNRLAAATETANSAVQWKQTFLYDRFGNRRFDAANTTTLIANDGVYNPQIDSATNRFTVAEGYNYDSEGNLTSNPESQLFSYDAENHLTQVQNTSSQTTATYQYDGTGKRVGKLVGDQGTVFVYDAFGKLVAEYATNQAVTAEGTKYLSADVLGSPRAITNNGGSVVSRHDYMPFGEEVYAGIGGRSTAQGYLSTGDGVRQQFTGYERDGESGLDYAQARYYSGKHGRFTSVDPLAASASVKSPQTFNRYSYGLNSPYKFTDPSGLCIVDSKEDKKPCKDFAGQVYVTPKGTLSNSSKGGGKPYNGPTFTGTAYGVNYEVTGGPNGGWRRISSQPTLGLDPGVRTAPPSAPPVEAPPVVDPPVGVPEVTGPGIISALMASDAARAAAIYFAIPLVVIMILPQTVQAPAPLPTSPTTDDDEDDDPPNSITLFRGLNATNPGAFRYDLDGVSTYEYPSSTHPRNLPIQVTYRGQKVPGTVALPTSPMLIGLRAVYTPQFGPGHWSIQGPDPETTKKQLSGYAKTVLK